MAYKRILAAAVAVIATQAAITFTGTAADLPEPRKAPPLAGKTFSRAAPPAFVPMSPAPSAPSHLKGIWAAIAYSATDERHGFFWGADQKEEAENSALKHCENAGGRKCSVVATFRNHRHWDDDDGSGFPYQPCGVLAVSTEYARGWAAAVAKTGNEAADLALKQCSRSGSSCEIREKVCT